VTPERALEIQLGAIDQVDLSSQRTSIAFVLKPNSELHLIQQVRFWPSVVATRILYTGRLPLHQKGPVRQRRSSFSMICTFFLSDHPRMELAASLNTCLKYSIKRTQKPTARPILMRSTPSAAPVLMTNTKITSHPTMMCLNRTTALRPRQVVARAVPRRSSPPRESGHCWEEQHCRAANLGRYFIAPSPRASR
jgi:hypothetical protein